MRFVSSVCPSCIFFSLRYCLWVGCGWFFVPFTHTFRTVVLALSIYHLDFWSFRMFQIYSNILWNLCLVRYLLRSYVKKNSVFRHLNLDEVRLSFLSIYSLGVFGSRRSFGLVRIFFCLLVSLKMISISLSFHSIYHTM